MRSHLPGSPVFVISLLLLCLSFVSHASQTPPNGAVILLYHHVSDSTPSSTSVSPLQFAEHMKYVNTHYNVKPLNDVILALQNGEKLNPDTVVITFDDGYRNILDNAHPILRQYGFPYTVFINPNEIGQRHNQLSWEQVNLMQQQGVSFANHTLDHLHMLERGEDEQEEDWLNRVWENVEQAEAQLLQHTGHSLKFLAFPFGEYNLALAGRLREKGYIGFAQHSGAIGPHSDFSALPRFAAAGPYAKLETLKTKIASLPMPVISSNFPDPQLPAGNPVPGNITLTLSGTDPDLTRANCYFAGRQITPQSTANTLSFSVESRLRAGRSRVNCTAPSKSQGGRYYWYSQPFFVADKDGKYPD
ncbi:polysaccharide deacetylase [Alteromonas aestuariivivens]|uniref:Polysaccharide deacetylase n=1 Tax=Alteromonas aestuariivivens TaxID=1938339 RepID=A0A3D8M599_9ALTE|nr:polysaccharide deacetylase [Alteromonas aestuariivivens]